MLYVTYTQSVLFSKVVMKIDASETTRNIKLFKYKSFGVYCRNIFFLKVVVEHELLKT